jgi:16S rRNA U1498 N3-methylase RsmE
MRTKRAQNKVPVIEPIRPLSACCFTQRRYAARDALALSTSETTLLHLRAPSGVVVTLSGPEGGLSLVEESAAQERGFPRFARPGRVRASTPLALLATSD